MSIEKIYNKLWINGLCSDIPDQEVKNFLRKYGDFIHMCRPKGTKYLFLTFRTDEKAADSLKELRKVFGGDCNYANVYGKSSKNGSKSTHRRSNSQSNGKVNRPAEQQQNGHANGRSSRKTVNFLNGSPVLITHVKDDFTFYARPNDTDFDEFIEEHLPLVAERTTHFAEAPKRGYLVLAQHNGKYRRALVESSTLSEDQQISVLLVDIGLKCKVAFNQLKVLPENYAQMRFTFSFKLDGFESFDRDSYAHKCFEMEIGQTYIMRTKDKKEFIAPGSKVELFTMKQQRSINIKLKELSQTFMVQELVQIPIETEVKQSAMVVDDSILKSDNILALVMNKDAQKYFENKQENQKAGDSLIRYPPYEPKYDEICLVKMDNPNDSLWYRASFIEQCGENKAQVFLVDRHSVVEIQMKNIRKIFQKIVREPILSFRAALKGIQPPINEVFLLRKYAKDSRVPCVTVVRDEEDSSRLLIHN